jgi:hypothetical protein
VNIYKNYIEVLEWRMHYEEGLYGVGNGQIGRKNNGRKKMYLRDERNEP